MLIKTRKTAAKLAEEWDSMFEGGKNQFILHFSLGHGPGYFGYRVGKAGALTRASLKCIAQ